MSKKLGDLIRQAREATSDAKTGKVWTQDRVAEEMGKTKQWISRVERGEQPPSLSLLLGLHGKLVGPDEQNPDASLTLWLLKLLERQVQDESISSDIRERTEAALNDALSQLTRPTLDRGQAGRTLEHFPNSFEPLTIVCGDRREVNPKTRGDIFAYSVSITDLTFLPQLRLPKNTTIRSDKLFALMGKEYLQREFGNSNLLVIGSPAVNFAARVINNHSVFRFNLPSWLKEKAELIRTLQERHDFGDSTVSLKQLNHRQSLEVFWQLAQNPENVNLALSGQKEGKDKEPFENLVRQVLNKSTIAPTDLTRVTELATMARQLLDGNSAKSLMNEFRTPGLMDFSDATIHGTSLRPDHDFALISVARNPFSISNEFISVMVAGIHGPGTAHALRALGEEDFHDHPLGGIIEVELDLYDDWPGRFQNATWKWQTKSYSVEKLLRNLKNASERDRAEVDRVFQRLSNEDIKSCIQFVEDLAVGLSG